jgi:DNA-binding winged helix-turn-helix (wHTH) protein/Tfp pilus assembly protein PilF
MSGQRPFELGGWHVEPARGALVRDGREMRLEPRLMDLLLLFAASAGRVISKDEIVAAVWGGRVIGDDTLAAAISRLRTALGERNGQRFIETLPKRGYRLIIDRESGSAIPPPDDPQSVDSLLRKGRAALEVPLPQSLAQAQVYFEAAVAAEPSSGQAHCGLAETMLARHYVGQGAQLALAAKAAARAATTLDPELAAAWSLLGRATLLADRDLATSDAALGRALTLDPNFAPAHRARAFGLAAAGRFVEAERAARRAVEIEPLSLASRTGLIQILLAARRYGSVLSEAKKAIALSAQSSDAWNATGWAQLFLGDQSAAVDALLESIRLLRTDAATIARLGALYDAAGFDGLCAAGADLFEQQRIIYVARPMDIAILRANAGQADAAFRALEEALRQDDPVLLFLPHLPHLDRIRNDPRFALLSQRARLVH